MMIKLIDLLNIIGWEQVINLDEGTLSNNKRLGTRTCSTWLGSKDIPDANVQALQISDDRKSICILLTRVSLDQPVNRYLDVLGSMAQLAGEFAGVIVALPPQNAPTGELEAKNDKEDGEK